METFLNLSKNKNVLKVFFGDVPIEEFTVNASGLSTQQPFETKHFTIL
jgi:hypothetical protein